MFTGLKETFSLFEKIVIPNMPTTVWNCISGKQSSSPRFSLVRPPTPELLSSHHAAGYCSSWQHLISSCQLQHGNFISGSQLEPGELLCGNVNSSVKLPGLLSRHASSSRQLSLNLYCHSNDCRCNVGTRRAGGTAGFYKSKPPRKT